MCLIMHNTLKMYDSGGITPSILRVYTKRIGVGITIYFRIPVVVDSNLYQDTDYGD
jgi:hypothetical protein